MATESDVPQSVSATDKEGMDRYVIGTDLDQPFKANQLDQSEEIPASTSFQVETGISNSQGKAELPQGEFFSELPLAVKLASKQRVGGYEVDDIPGEVEEEMQVNRKTIQKYSNTKTTEVVGPEEIPVCDPNDAEEKVMIGEVRDLPANAIPTLKQQELHFQGEGEQNFTDATVLEQIEADDAKGESSGGGIQKNVEDGFSSPHMNAETGRVTDNETEVTEHISVFESIRNFFHTSHPTVPELETSGQNIAEPTREFESEDTVPNKEDTPEQDSIGQDAPGGVEQKDEKDLYFDANESAEEIFESLPVALATDVSSKVVEPVSRAELDSEAGNQEGFVEEREVPKIEPSLEVASEETDESASREHIETISSAEVGSQEGSQEPNLAEILPGKHGYENLERSLKTTVPEAVDAPASSAGEEHIFEEEEIREEKHCGITESIGETGDVSPFTLSKEVLPEETYADASSEFVEPLSHDELVPRAENDEGVVEECEVQKIETSLEMASEEAEAPVLNEHIEAISSRGVDLERRPETNLAEALPEKHEDEKLEKSLKTEVHEEKDATASSTVNEFSFKEEEIREGKHCDGAKQGMHEIGDGPPSILNREVMLEETNVHASSDFVEPTSHSESDSQPGNREGVIEEHDDRNTETSLEMASAEADAPVSNEHIETISASEDIKERSQEPDLAEVSPDEHEDEMLQRSSKTAASEEMDAPSSSTIEELSFKEEEMEEDEHYNGATEGTDEIGYVSASILSKEVMPEETYVHASSKIVEPLSHDELDSQAEKKEGVGEECEDPKTEQSVEMALEGTDAPASNEHIETISSAAVDLQEGSQEPKIGDVPASILSIEVLPGDIPVHEPNDAAQENVKIGEGQDLPETAIPTLKQQELHFQSEGERNLPEATILEQIEANAKGESSGGGMQKNVEDEFSSLKRNTETERMTDNEAEVTEHVSVFESIRNFFHSPHSTVPELETGGQNIAEPTGEFESEDTAPDKEDTPEQESIGQDATAGVEQKDEKDLHFDVNDLVDGKLESLPVALAADVSSREAAGAQVENPTHIICTQEKQDHAGESQNMKEMSFDIGDITEENHMVTESMSGEEARDEMNIGENHDEPDLTHNDAERITVEELSLKEGEFRADKHQDEATEGKDEIADVPNSTLGSNVMPEETFADASSKVVEHISHAELDSQAGDQEGVVEEREGQKIEPSLEVASEEIDEPASKENMETISSTKVGLQEGSQEPAEVSPDEHEDGKLERYIKTAVPEEIDAPASSIIEDISFKEEEMGKGKHYNGATEGTDEIGDVPASIVKEVMPEETYVHASSKLVEPISHDESDAQAEIQEGVGEECENPKTVTSMEIAPEETDAPESYEHLETISSAAVDLEGHQEPIFSDALPDKHEDDKLKRSFKTVSEGIDARASSTVEEHALEEEEIREEKHYGVTERTGEIGDVPASTVSSEVWPEETNVHASSKFVEPISPDELVSEAENQKGAVEECEDQKAERSLEMASEETDAPVSNVHIDTISSEAVDFQKRDQEANIAEVSPDKHEDEKLEKSFKTEVHEEKDATASSTVKGISFKEEEIREDKHYEGATEGTDETEDVPSSILSKEMTPEEMNVHAFSKTVEPISHSESDSQPGYPEGVVEERDDRNTDTSLEMASEEADPHVSNEHIGTISSAEDFQEGSHEPNLADISPDKHEETDTSGSSTIKDLDFNEDIIGDDIHYNGATEGTDVIGDIPASIVNKEVIPEETCVHASSKFVEPISHDELDSQAENQEDVVEECEDLKTEASLEMAQEETDAPASNEHIETISSAALDLEEHPEPNLAGASPVKHEDDNLERSLKSVSEGIDAPESSTVEEHTLEEDEIREDKHYDGVTERTAEITDVAASIISKEVLPEDTYVHASSEIMEPLSHAELVSEEENKAGVGEGCEDPETETSLDMASEETDAPISNEHIETISPAEVGFQGGQEPNIAEKHEDEKVEKSLKTEVEEIGEPASGKYIETNSGVEDDFPAENKEGFSEAKQEDGIVLDADVSRDEVNDDKVAGTSETALDVEKISPNECTEQAASTKEDTIQETGTLIKKEIQPYRSTSVQSDTQNSNLSCEEYKEEETTEEELKPESIVEDPIQEISEETEEKDCSRNSEPEKVNEDDLSLSESKENQTDDIIRTTEDDIATKDNSEILPEETGEEDSIRENKEDINNLLSPDEQVKDPKESMKNEDQIGTEVKTEEQFASYDILEQNADRTEEEMDTEDTEEVRRDTQVDEQEKVLTTEEHEKQENPDLVRAEDILEEQSKENTGVGSGEKSELYSRMRNFTNTRSIKLGEMTDNFDQEGVDKTKTSTDEGEKAEELFEARENQEPQTLTKEDKISETEENLVPAKNSDNPQDACETETTEQSNEATSEKSATGTEIKMDDNIIKSYVEEIPEESQEGQHELVQEEELKLEVEDKTEEIQNEDETIKAAILTEEEPKEAEKVVSDEIIESAQGEKILTRTAEELPGPCNRDESDADIEVKETTETNEATSETNTTGTEREIDGNIIQSSAENVPGELQEGQHELGQEELTLEVEDQTEKIQNKDKTIKASNLAEEELIVAEKAVSEETIKSAEGYDTNATTTEELKDSCSGDKSDAAMEVKETGRMADNETEVTEHISLFKSIRNFFHTSHPTVPELETSGQNIAEPTREFESEDTVPNKEDMPEQDTVGQKDENDLYFEPAEEILESPPVALVRDVSSKVVEPVSRVKLDSEAGNQEGFVEEHEVPKLEPSLEVASKETDEFASQEHIETISSAEVGSQEGTQEPNYAEIIPDKHGYDNLERSLQTTVPEEVDAPASSAGDTFEEEEIREEKHWGVTESIGEIGDEKLEKSLKTEVHEEKDTTDSSTVNERSFKEEEIREDKHCDGAKQGVDEIGDGPPSILNREVMPEETNVHVSSNFVEPTSHSESDSQPGNREGIIEEHNDRNTETSLEMASEEADAPVSNEHIETISASKDIKEQSQEPDLAEVSPDRHEDEKLERSSKTAAPEEMDAPGSSTVEELSFKEKEMEDDKHYNGATEGTDEIRDVLASILSKEVMPEETHVHASSKIVETLSHDELESHAENQEGVGEEVDKTKTSLDEEDKAEELFEVRENQEPRTLTKEDKITETEENLVPAKHSDNPQDACETETTEQSNEATSETSATGTEINMDDNIIKGYVEEIPEESQEGQHELVQEEELKLEVEDKTEEIQNEDETIKAAILTEEELKESEKVVSDETIESAQGANVLTRTAEEFPGSCNREESDADIEVKETTETNEATSETNTTGTEREIDDNIIRSHVEKVPEELQEGQHELGQEELTLEVEDQTEKIQNKDKTIKASNLAEEELMVAEKAVSEETIKSAEGYDTNAPTTEELKDSCSGDKSDAAMEVKETTVTNEATSETIPTDTESKIDDALNQSYVDKVSEESQEGRHMMDQDEKLKQLEDQTEQIHNDEETVKAAILTEEEQKAEKVDGEETIESSQEEKTITSTAEESRGSCNEDESHAAIKAKETPETNEATSETIPTETERKIDDDLNQSYVDKVSDESREGQHELDQEENLKSDVKDRTEEIQNEEETLKAAILTGEGQEADKGVSEETIESAQGEKTIPSTAEELQGSCNEDDIDATIKVKDTIETNEASSETNAIETEKFFDDIQNQGYVEKFSEESQEGQHELNEEELKPELQDRTEEPQKEDEVIKAAILTEEEEREVEKVFSVETVKCAEGDKVITSIVEESQGSCERDESDAAAEIKESVKTNDAASKTIATETERTIYDVPDESYVQKASGESQEGQHELERGEESKLEVNNEDETIKATILTEKEQKEDEKVFIAETTECSLRDNNITTTAEESQGSCTGDKMDASNENVTRERDVLASAEGTEKVKEITHLEHEPRDISVEETDSSQTAASSKDTSGVEAVTEKDGTDEQTLQEQYQMSFPHPVIEEEFEDIKYITPELEDNSIHIVTTEPEGSENASVIQAEETCMQTEESTQFEGRQMELASESCLISNQNEQNEEPKKATEDFGEQILEEEKLTEEHQMPFDALPNEHGYSIKVDTHEKNIKEEGSEEEPKAVEESRLHIKDSRLLEDTQSNPLHEENIEEGVQGEDLSSESKSRKNLENAEAVEEDRVSCIQTLPLEKLEETRQLSTSQEEDQEISGATESIEETMVVAEALEDSPITTEEAPLQKELQEQELHQIHDRTHEDVGNLGEEKPEEQHVMLNDHGDLTKFREPEQNVMGAEVPEEKPKATAETGLQTEERDLASEANFGGTCDISKIIGRRDEIRSIESAPVEKSEELSHSTPSEEEHKISEITKNIDASQKDVEGNKEEMANEENEKELSNNSCITYSKDINAIAVDNSGLAPEMENLKDQSETPSATELFFQEQKHEAPATPEHIIVNAEEAEFLNNKSKGVPGQAKGEETGTSELPSGFLIHGSAKHMDDLDKQETSEEIFELAEGDDAYKLGAKSKESEILEMPPDIETDNLVADEEEYIKATRTADINQNDVQRKEISKEKEEANKSHQEHILAAEGGLDSIEFQKEEVQEIGQINFTETTKNPIHADISSIESPNQATAENQDIKESFAGESQIEENKIMEAGYVLNLESQGSDAMSDAFKTEMMPSAEKESRDKIPTKECSTTIREEIQPGDRAYYDSNKMQIPKEEELSEAREPKISTDREQASGAKARELGTAEILDDKKQHADAHEEIESKHSIFDLLHQSTKETQATREFKETVVIQEAFVHVEAGKSEKHKSDEEKDEDEAEEGEEHKKTDSGSDGPVMVEAHKDMEIKTPNHKKSHNILSGMGSKVKHSISKVKKAITGKSSHSKQHSPK